MPKTVVTVKFDRDSTFHTMLEKIKEDSGSSTYSATLRHCLGEVYHKRFPAYRVLAEARHAHKSRNATEKLQDQLAEDEEAQLAICTAVTGWLTDDGPHKTCHWKTYHKIGPRSLIIGEIGKDITFLIPDDVTNQYKGGSKEQIAAIIADPEAKILDRSAITTLSSS